MFVIILTYLATSIISQAPAALPAPGGTPATGLAGNGFEWSCAAIGKTDYGWKCIEYAKPK
jgi:hypothetical protein